MLQIKLNADNFWKYIQYSIHQQSSIAPSISNDCFFGFFLHHPPYILLARWILCLCFCFGATLLPSTPRATHCYPIQLQSKQCSRCNDSSRKYNFTRHWLEKAPKIITYQRPATRNPFEFHSISSKHHLLGIDSRHSLTTEQIIYASCHGRSMKTFILESKLDGPYVAYVYNIIGLFHRLD